MNRLALSASIIVIATALAGTSRAAPQYTAVDIGTLSAQYPYTAVGGINSFGQVAGWSTYDAQTTHAFFWRGDGKTMINLGSLGGDETLSQAFALNDSSYVVGRANDQGFVWTPQTGMRGVGFLPGGSTSILLSINSSDVAVGAATTVGASYPHPIIWDAGKGIRDLNLTIVNPPTDWTPGNAMAISQNGLITGVGSADPTQLPPQPNEHAYVLDAGTLTTIPDPGVYMQPEAINSSGEVVGFFEDANGHRHAFVYTPALGTRDIGSLGSSVTGTWPAFTEALGVNDAGMVVGADYWADGSKHGFLYTDLGGMVDLNTLVQLNDDNIDGGDAINDSGQIAAGVQNSREGYHELLLTPVPEPSTFALLILLIFIILLYRFALPRLAALREALVVAITRYNGPIHLSAWKNEENGSEALQVRRVLSCSGGCFVSPVGFLVGCRMPRTPRLRICGRRFVRGGTSGRP